MICSDKFPLQDVESKLMFSITRSISSVSPFATCFAQAALLSTDIYHMGSLKYLKTVPWGVYTPP